MEGDNEIQGLFTSCPIIEIKRRNGEESGGLGGSKSEEEQENQRKQERMGEEILNHQSSQNS